MSVNNFDDPTPGRVLFWGVAALVTFTIVGFGLRAAGLVGGTALDRVVIQESRQYAETNTDAFYKTLAASKALDVRLADPSTPESVRAGIIEQQEFYASEMRRQVAKIPVDARTADMVRYGGVQ